MKGEIERTYQQERGKLFSYIRSKISDSEEAEDILQEVFCQALRSPNVTDSVDNLLGWLYTVAHNRIIDWYRRKKHRTVPYDDASVALSLHDLVRESGVQLDRELVRDAVVDAISEALDDLPDAQREVFVWQAIEGRTFREISSVTGVPVNTLIARKRYAVMRMREQLREVKELIE